MGAPFCHFFLLLASLLSARGRSAEGLRINAPRFSNGEPSTGDVCSFARYLTQRGRWEVGGLADKHSAEVCLALLAPWAPTGGAKVDAWRCRAPAQTRTFDFIWMCCLFNRPPSFHQQHCAAFFLPFLKSRFDSRLREKLPAVYLQMITVIRGGGVLEPMLVWLSYQHLNPPFAFILWSLGLKFPAH